MTKEKRKEDVNKNSTSEDTENVKQPIDLKTKDPDVADVGGNAKIENSLQELQKKVETLTKEKEDYLLAAQRVQAEFDNYRKRNSVAVADAYNDGMRECVQLILPVLDNLQRALEAAQKEADGNSLLGGVEKVQKQFLDILAKIGVEEIIALHEPFNPEFHHAVVKVDAKEENESGLVVEVFEKGYRLKNKVLRYSMVKVAN